MYHMSKHFEPEFKKKIVRLYLEDGRTIRALAAELGVSKASISNCKDSGDRPCGFTKALSKAQNGESYTSILKFYYNNSSNTNNKTVKIVSY